MNRRNENENQLNIVNLLLNFHVLNIIRTAFVTMIPFYDFTPNNKCMYLQMNILETTLYPSF